MGKTSLHFVPLSSPPSETKSRRAPFCVVLPLPQESTTKPIDEISRLLARVAELEHKLKVMESAKKQFTTLVHLFAMLFALVATSNQPEGGSNSAPVGKSALLLHSKIITLRPKFWRIMVLFTSSFPGQ